MTDSSVETLRCDEPLIHIGYHKTGTSYLQSKFFIAEHGFLRWPPNQAIVHPLLIDLGPFESVSAKSVAILQESADTAKRLGLQWVCSHERLSGHVSSGGYDSKALADRLRSIMPTAKVLVVIREQRDAIRSAYSQFVTEGGSLSLYKYLHDPQAPIRKVPLFSLKHFQYLPLIQYYRSIFGPSRVLVLPYELLRKSPVEFLNRIGSFALGDQFVSLTKETYQAEWVNRRFSVVTQCLRRQLNATCFRTQFSNSGFINAPILDHAFRKFDGLLEWLVPGALDRYLMARQSRLIHRYVGDYFSEFNKKTSEIIGYDLSEYGYL